MIGISQVGKYIFNLTVSDSMLRSSSGNYRQSLRIKGRILLANTKKQKTRPYS